MNVSVPQQLKKFLPYVLSLFVLIFVIKQSVDGIKTEKAVITALMNHYYVFGKIVSIDQSDHRRNLRIYTVGYRINKSYFTNYFLSDLTYALKDSVLLQYAISAPSISRIVEKNCMKKYAFRVKSEYDLNLTSNFNKQSKQRIKRLYLSKNESYFFSFFSALTLQAIAKKNSLDQYLEKFEYTNSLPNDLTIRIAGNKLHFVKINLSDYYSAYYVLKKMECKNNDLAIFKTSITHFKIGDDYRTCLHIFHQSAYLTVSDSLPFKIELNSPNDCECITLEFDHNRKLRKWTYEINTSN